MEDINELNYNLHLFPISLDFTCFNNNEHVNNFTKYLFSKSNNHMKNEYTSLNYGVMDFSESKEAFNSTEESYNKFCSFFKGNYNYKNLLSSIFYVGFFIEYENKLYTNLLKPSEKEDELLDLSWSADMLNEYLENTGNTIQELIEEIETIIRPFEPYSNGNIVLLEEMINNQDDKLNFIQSIIFSEIGFMYQQFYKKHNIKDLLYISHIDQPKMFYHIHLLIEKKEN